MARMRPSQTATTENKPQSKPTELERSIATMQNIQPKVEKNVLTLPVEDFIRHRDSVVTGLTTLIGNINDFNRAFIRDTNQMLGGSLAGSENSYAITNFLQTASSLSGLVGGAVPGDKAGGKKAKKEKKERDPNAPKRPLTAYFLFSSSARPIVKEDLGPEAAPNDVAGEVLRRWNNMGDQEKQRWKDEYERNNTKYKAEVADYKASLGVAHDDPLPDEAIPEIELEIYPHEDTDEAGSSDDDAAAPPPPPPPAKATKGGKKKGAAAAAKENGVSAAAAPHSPSPSAQLMKETPIPFPGAEAKKAEAGKRKRGAKDDSPTEPKKPRKGKAAAAAAAAAQQAQQDEVVASTETAAAPAAAPEKKGRKKRKSEA